jgi:hypothetical protein
VSEFPERLRIEADRHFDFLENPPIFNIGAANRRPDGLMAPSPFRVPLRRPLAPTSVAQQRFRFLQYLSALVHRGMPREAMIDLRAVLRPEVIEKGLLFFYERAGGKMTVQLGQIGLVLRSIAKYKGTMNALFLKDLGQKVRRGLEGRVRQGRSGGGICYGYNVALEHDARGEPIRGGRRINEAEAAIVRRIFMEFASGKSPRRIAIDLNREGIPGPAGAKWGPSTINGNAARGTGILNNEFYVGRYVWNRLPLREGPAHRQTRLTHQRHKRIDRPRRSRSPDCPPGSLGTCEGSASVDQAGHQARCERRQAVLGEAAAALSRLGTGEVRRTWGKLREDQPEPVRLRRRARPWHLR